MHNGETDPMYGKRVIVKAQREAGTIIRVDRTPDQNPYCVLLDRGVDQTTWEADDSITVIPRAHLQFGCNQAIPDGVHTAWGARWIVKQDGYVDQVPNRQDCVGPDEERKVLLDYLNSGAGTKARRTAAQMLADYTLRTNGTETVTLYEDEKLVFKGNPQGSYGYLYVVAYFK